jgi:hypothetical protein
MNCNAAEWLMRLWSKFDGNEADPTTVFFHEIGHSWRQATRRFCTRDVNYANKIPAFQREFQELAVVLKSLSSYREPSEYRFVP